MMFLHIGFGFRDPPRPEELEPIFDKASDWTRYGPDCWIVWTSASPAKWLARLKPILSPTDHVFIVRIDLSESTGRLPESVWKWMEARQPPLPPVPPPRPLEPVTDDDRRHEESDGTS